MDALEGMDNKVSGRLAPRFSGRQLRSDTGVAFMKDSQGDSVLWGFMFSLSHSWTHSSVLVSLHSEGDLWTGNECSFV